MIRIKVVRASQLALGAALILLAIAVAVTLAGFWFSAQGSAQTSQETAGAEEVAALAAFSEVDETPMNLLPEEDEHSDAVVEQAPKKRVLIYHTHTHEAYEQVEDDLYEEISAWRTADEKHSVVRVGEALAELMRLSGFEVVHDTTDHEPPKLGTAYARSLQTLEGYDEPFDLYVDLHRDEYAGSGSASSVALVSQDVSYARLMLLVGKGESFRDKPDYDANLAFARALTDELNGLLPGLCRDVMIKTGRYNQHVGTPAILVEVGHNRNTLEQALASMPYLAEALTRGMAASAAS